MSLSASWTARSVGLLSRTTDEARRLALALGTVKSAVRVVDRSMPKMSVDWAAVDDEGHSMSYTDFANHAIRINPGPILDTAIDHATALDVGIGFGLHEASHSQESRDRYKYLIKREQRPGAFERSDPSTVEVPAFEPMRVAAYLWNLVEDVRIEQVTGRNWPGFVPYFRAVLKYMWTQMRRKHELPTEYAPDIAARLRTVFLACRYPRQFSPTDETLVAEVAWWQAWQHDYLTDAVDTPTTIQRGLDHLAEDAETAKELEDNKAAERREREAGERLKNQIDRLIREGVKGSYTICIDEQGEVVPLDAETAEEVDKLVREGLVEVKTVVRAPGANIAPVFLSRPEETPASRRAYLGKPDATTEALRAALVFRPSAPQHDQKLLKSGRMDDQELYRWALGDYRVFSERVIEAKPDAFIGLLCDVSGSMYGRKLETAQRLAQLLVWALHDQEGVETAVWAHTADIGSGNSADVFRVWAKGDPMSRLGLLGTLDNGNNRDGTALETVCAEVAQAEQPEKVVVVLSDGIPSGNGYGGSPAMDHVRAVTRWAAQRGVRCIQIAIDPYDLRPEQQSRMYGDSWIGYTSEQALPKQLAALLSRYV